MLKCICMYQKKLQPVFDSFIQIISFYKWTNDKKYKRRNYLDINIIMILFYYVACDSGLVWGRTAGTEYSTGRDRSNVDTRQRQIALGIREALRFELCLF